MSSFVNDASADSGRRRLEELDEEAAAATGTDAEPRVSSAGAIVVCAVFAASASVVSAVGSGVDGDSSSCCAIAMALEPSIAAVCAPCCFRAVAFLLAHALHIDCDLLNHRSG